MAAVRVTSQLRHLLAEADGGNHLAGTYADLPALAIGTAGAPARQAEFVDAANPQIRLTNSAGLYTDLYTGPQGSLRIIPSGGKVGLNISSTPNGALQILGLTPAAVATTPGTNAEYAIYATGGLGGDTTIATTGVGGNGGRVLISGANGGVAASAVTASTSGNGGQADIYAGHGGACSVAGTGTNKGGNGAACTMNGGNGGASSGASSGSNTGGTGGNCQITAGVGGAATVGSGTLVGGGGGTVNIAAGAGGAGTSGGNGGGITLQCGAAGAGTGGTKGNITMQAGGTGFLGLGIAPVIHFHQAETSTITGAVTDGYSASQRHAPTYSGAFTVTRHNYMDLVHPVLSGSAVVTDACIFRFDQAAGTHPAVAAGSTKTTPGTVNAWLKANINSTLYFIPCYTSMTT